jgi:peptidoglycan/LPS O-acetylase OafA/YrhL
VIVAFAVAFAVAVFALAAFPVVERTRREPRQRWSTPSTGFDLNARTVTPTRRTRSPLVAAMCEPVGGSD